MKIHIHAPFEVNSALKELIEKRVQKLTTFYDRIIKADVYLKLEDKKSPDGQIVEINMHLPGKDAFAKEGADSFEKAVAATTNKLERQLKKRKEKLAK